MPEQSKEYKVEPKKRYYFFLNPYEEYAFTKCPKCEGKTKLKKIPLVIHIEPRQLFVMNKQCRYCPNCELIITKKTEVEAFLAASLKDVNPEIVGNEYFVLGTVDRDDWKQAKKGEFLSDEVAKRTYIFKEVLNFKVIPAGWYFPDKD